MWKRVYDLFTRVFTLLERQERQEKGLKDQGEEIKRLTTTVTRLAHELQRTQDALSNQAEREAYERRMLLLEIENRLLKEKLQLPPQITKNKDDEENEK